MTLCVCLQRGVQGDYSPAIRLTMVFPVGFCSYLRPVTPLFLFIPPFWSRNVYCRCILEVCVSQFMGQKFVSGWIMPWVSPTFNLDETLDFALLSWCWNKLILQVYWDGMKIFLCEKVISFRCQSRMLWFVRFPLSLCAGNLIPNAASVRGSIFKRWLGPEGSVPRSMLESQQWGSYHGSAFPVKGCIWPLPCCLCLACDVFCHVTMQQEGPLHMQLLILDLLVSRTMSQINFYCL